MDIERELLRKVDAGLVLAETGDEGELARLALDVDEILTCRKRVSERVLRNAPRCQAVGRYGIGLDNIDVRFATQSGIVVTNVANFCMEEVSDHAMALLFSLARKVTFSDRAIKAGTYELQAGTPLRRLREQRLGIVGSGKTARALCCKAHAFGLKLLVYSQQQNDKHLAEHGAEVVTFNELLAGCDYISIHVPLTPETLHLFNLEAFRRMKATAFLINTSRGDVIESHALLTALDEGLIAGLHWMYCRRSRLHRMIRWSCIPESSSRPTRPSTLKSQSRSYSARLPPRWRTCFPERSRDSSSIQRSSLSLS